MAADVRTAFDRIAASLLTGADVPEFAGGYGYTVAEVSAVPVAADLGLMCGHPLRFADVRPGDVVVDLGCGGGLDVLLAAQLAGRAVGIDLSPRMIERAEINGRGKAVEFRVAALEVLPFEAASADCVVSNNAFHYADAAAGFAEAFRVLKPGGRLAFCDLAWRLAPPDDFVDDPALNAGGILSVVEIGRLLRRRGFEVDLAITEGVVLPRGGRKPPSDEDRLACWVEASQGCCGVEPLASASRYHDALAAVGDRLAAVQVRATKPMILRKESQ